MQAEETYLDRLRNCLGEVSAPVTLVHHRKASEFKNYLDGMLWVKYGAKERGRSAASPFLAPSCSLLLPFSCFNLLEFYR